MDQQQAHEPDGLHIIFVGDVEEKWKESTVPAEQIMRHAGVAEPAQFILEALDNKGGNPVAEFSSKDSVDLNAKDRKFFRVTPGGGGPVLSDLEDKLPQPFAEALRDLREKRGPEARVDAIDANFAYIWVSTIVKNTPGEEPGGWIRLPLAFPFANPHGLVTKAALRRKGEGTVADGYNPSHDMCNPVRSLGGGHYYSWTWQDAPVLRSPEDILGVVQWYERRIRNG